jgi:hypothetical protein
MFDNKRILDYDESYLLINYYNPKNRYPSTYLFLVNETFFDSYFFPIDKRIINVFFIEDKKQILNINIHNNELIYELIEKGYELIENPIILM